MCICTCVMCINVFMSVCMYCIWMDEWMDGYCHWKENVTKSRACILYVNQL